MKHNIDTTVNKVYPDSIAEEAGIEVGDKIISINGSEFYDVLEYRYLVSESEITVEVLKKNGDTEMLEIENNYEDLGVEFHSGLIDEAQSCRNKCIFCFIDQLPKGMRETVYFKDDDTRLSFLQGNYVTLTNMNDEEIDRMIKMRISPINISVHTTNPELRKKMLCNRFAGKLYGIMQKFAENEMHMNGQIVLCPGFNDKEELDRTINDLANLYPYINSVSVVPVGLTRYREGLCQLTPFDAKSAYDTVMQVTEWQEELKRKLGTRLIYLSDEFYINAKLPIPKPETYEGFPQIENGVGLISSMREEFDEAVTLIKPKKRRRNVMMVTGEIAYDFIAGLAKRVEDVAEGVKVSVYAIKNEFFGGGVNVSGLVVGGDIIKQIADKPKADTLIIPSVMLRSGEDIFLDDSTVGDVEKALGMPVSVCENDGYSFIETILDEELEF